jgi:hypothetical protein
MKQLGTITSGKRVNLIIVYSMSVVGNYVYSTPGKGYHCTFVRMALWCLFINVQNAGGLLKIFFITGCFLAFWLQFSEFYTSNVAISCGVASSLLGASPGDELGNGH